VYHAGSDYHKFYNEDAYIAHIPVAMSADETYHCTFEVPLKEPSRYIEYALGLKTGVLREK